MIDDIPDEMLHDETPNVFESEMLDVYEPLIMVDELSEHSEEKMLCFP